MPKNAIVVDGLAKYYGSVTALQGVNFEVQSGTVFGLLGPNGAGKTTIIRILATILRPDGGRATVMGHDVVREPGAVRACIGLAGQNAAVDPNLTGEENLRLIGKLGQLPWRDVGRRADELLQRFDLVEAGKRPVRTYSGGMRRRLDIAAALVARPPVLFLDEPTTGLDIQSRTELWDLINELVAEGATVLLTTQYLEEADRLATRIAVVDKGGVVANDEPAALKAQLGATVIEIGASDEAAAQRLIGLLEPFGKRLERDGLIVRLASSGDPRALFDVIRALERDSLLPASLSVREPSMDDVFLALTGHHAEVESPQPAAAARNSGGAT
ncbi:MAG TPA: ATP-binding cassette domain-containing protein [Dehalococcoidia bacterium]|nr:ATP-binding cassette domain-containing protein [Dehalococcoidia bacterium]